MPVNQPTLQLRRMGLQDLRFVVELHQSAFQEGFFVRLGGRFLRRYYRTFLDGPLATALVCEVDDEVCGYLVGVLNPPEHRRLLLHHHGASLVFHAFAGLAWRPRLALLFIRTRLARYLHAFARQARGGGARVSETAAPAVLTYVAVDPRSRGRGVGSALVAQFLDEAAAAGRSEARLVTIAGGGGAGGFYTSHDWARVGESLRADGQSLEHFSFRLDRQV